MCGYPVQMDDDGQAAERIAEETICPLCLARFPPFTFLIDYPYPAYGTPALGELGETEFRFTFEGDNLQVAVEQITFGAEPMILQGTR